MACCMWWCTPDGPVQVTANPEGDLVPPANAVSGPYRTGGEAAAGCEVLVSVQCNQCPPLGDPFCTTPWTLAGAYTLSFVNKTGTYTALPNSMTLLYNQDGGLAQGCSTGTCVGYGPRYGNIYIKPPGGFVNTLYATLEFCWSCMFRIPVADPMVPLGVLIPKLTIHGGLVFYCNTSKATTASGWRCSVGGTSCVQCPNAFGVCFSGAHDDIIGTGTNIYGCGQVFDSSQFVGTIFNDSGVGCDGSADVYLLPG